jgi:UDP-N-acetylmuramate dehydrogenase
MNADAFIRRDVPLAPFTTIGLGGPAAYCAECGTVQEVCDALSFAARKGIPVQVLAGGSNVVFADEGFDGLVLHLSLRGVDARREGDAILVTAAAGEAWDLLVVRAIEKGWGGWECLSGIPGTVGATPMQNVGAYGQEVADTIVSVRALDRKTLKEVEISRNDCAFSYRQSRFKSTDAGRYIITEVEFRLHPQGRADLRYGELRDALGSSVDLAALRPGAETLAAVRGAVIALRRKKSMVLDPADENSRSVGSFFTNPVITGEHFGQVRKIWKKEDGGKSEVPSFPARDGVKIPAAWLVEKSGFPKGLRRGGVGISEHHALALVNRGGTTRQLAALANEIREAVHSRFGIRLALEPEIVPFRP